MADVIDRFSNMAARTPTATAVAGALPTTYATFVARARSFAAALDGCATPRVLIALDKGPNAYAAMFGTLMAGGTYAPVNVSSPPARLAEIARQFEPHRVVAEAPLAMRLAEPARHLDPCDLQPSDIAPKTPADLAYVMFTSGSTGAPKGVAIPRDALNHYVDWLGPALGIRPGDRMSQHPNIGFDLSVLDIFGALCFGAALHPLTGAGARLLPARAIAEQGITIWNSVPSVLSLMRQAGELDAAHLASVRLFTFCGELLHADQVADVFAARPDAVVLNTYGPTEATVAMTCRRLTAKTHVRLCRPSAPLGAPIGDMRLTLSDGDQGEILISGPQVAAGYWGDPNLSAQKFRNGTFHTGDYAERIDDELYFLGRRDDMVKLRGHRIHLGEIRQALAGLGFPESHVFARDGVLCAIVEKGSGHAFNEEAVKRSLAIKLDAYFIPETIRCIESLPRTANDKLDAAALEAMRETPAASLPSPQSSANRPRSRRISP